MATVFETQCNLSQEALFVMRVEQAIVKVAKNVQSEALASATVPAASTLTAQAVHDRRSVLANKVLLDPGSYAKLFAVAVAANSVITSGSPDNDIEFEVSASWNALAISGTN